MSRTYRADHWDVRLKVACSENDWKRELREEMEDMDGVTVWVYVIVNEWTPEGSECDLREVVDNRYFSSEDEAWEHLSQVAEAYGYELDPQESEFSLAPARGISQQSYYIEGLWSNG